MKCRECKESIQPSEIYGDFYFCPNCGCTYSLSPILPNDFGLLEMSPETLEWGEMFESLAQYDENWRQSKDDTKK